MESLFERRKTEKNQTMKKENAKQGRVCSYAWKTLPFVMPSSTGVHLVESIILNGLESVG